MAKKYLSFEEAADLLGITSAQLKRFLEKGEIHGLRDRNTWKFRADVVEEFLRSRQTDSSPEFPIISDDSSDDSSSSSSMIGQPNPEDFASSDSDVRLFVDESLFDDDKESLELADAGSDVRLGGDSGPKLEAEGDEALDFSGWDSDVNLSDSDSDVKLVGASTDTDADLSKTSKLSDSDSDVLLAEGSGLMLSDSDSDVRLTGDDDSGNTNELSFADADSDSDVKLMGSDDLLADDSDSDVKLSSGLDRTDSDIRLAELPPGGVDSRTIVFSAIPDDSDLKLIKGSGINLEARGSGIGLDADESGISLEIDSGISLEADDSGISLEGFDSGASLADDSGISLEAGDSGISLDLDDDSGISLQTDLGSTMPLQSMPKGKSMADSSTMATQFDMAPPGTSNDSEFELAGLDDDDDDLGTNTGVLTFEDDEDDNSSRTVAAPALSAEAEVDDELDAGFDDAGFDDDGGFEDDGFEDEDHDEFMDDEDDIVDDAEDLDDDYDGGGSHVSPAAAVHGVARAEVDWGIAVKSLIGLSAVLSIVCAVMGVELIRTMWIWTQPGNESTPSSMVQMIGGLF